MQIFLPKMKQMVIYLSMQRAVWISKGLLYGFILSNSVIMKVLCFFISFWFWIAIYHSQNTPPPYTHTLKVRSFMDLENLSLHLLHGLMYYGTTWFFHTWATSDLFRLFLLDMLSLLCKWWIFCLEYGN